jgi:hypothetical protein
MSKGLPAGADGYNGIHGDIVALLEAARRAAARSVNALMTASYWEIGRRIVEFDQGGQERAIRGQQLLQRLSADLQQRFGRGFSVDNLEQMRLFYLAYPSQHISEKLSRKSPAAGEAGKSETASRNISLEQLALALPLSWSHYVHLVRGTRSAQEREFYEAEAPVGLILCARTNAAVARYALDGLPNKVMAAEYQTVLPDARLLEARRVGRGGAEGVNE